MNLENNVILLSTVVFQQRKAGNQHIQQKQMNKQKTKQTNKKST